MEKKIKKKYLLTTMIILLIGSFIFFNNSTVKNNIISFKEKISLFMEIDSCLDSGGCWDFIRHRCEMNDQGYCERNEQECIEHKGIWDKDKNYCNLQDN